MYYFEGLSYSQKSQNFISLIMEFEDLDKLSTTLIYGEHEYGYQRALLPRHYNEMVKDILGKETVFPTSIIIGVNKEDISIENNSKSRVCKINIINDDKPFRIIDGQHRLKALALAKKTDAQLNNFELNVILILLDQETRYKEIEIFQDINSKAKRIRTDLAILARYNYQLIENAKKGTLKVDEVIEHICVKVAQSLNDDPNSLWFHEIKFDIHETHNPGLIGVGAFVSSIKRIVKFYVEKENINLKLDSLALHEVEAISQKIKYVLKAVWQIVRERWPSYFEGNNTSHSQTNFKEYYNFEFKKMKGDQIEGYLQKTTGANAIHLIFEELLREADAEEELALDNFKKLLNNSIIKSEDWAKNKKFVGMTSQSGFKRAADLIKNNELE